MYCIYLFRIRRHFRFNEREKRVARGLRAAGSKIGLRWSATCVKIGKIVGFMGKLKKQQCYTTTSVHLEEPSTTRFVGGQKAGRGRTHRAVGNFRENCDDFGQEACPARAGEPVLKANTRLQKTSRSAPPGPARTPLRSPAQRYAPQVARHYLPILPNRLPPPLCPPRPPPKPLLVSSIECRPSKPAPPPPHPLW